MVERGGISVAVVQCMGVWLLLTQQRVSDEKGYSSGCWEAWATTWPALLCYCPLSQCYRLTRSGAVLSPFRPGRLRYLDSLSAP